MKKIKRYLLFFSIGYFIAGIITPIIYGETSFLSVLLSVLPMLMTILFFCRQKTKKNTPLFILLFFIISYFFVFFTGDIVRFIYYDKNTAVIVICLFVNILSAVVFDILSRKNKREVGDGFICDYKKCNLFIYRRIYETIASLYVFLLPFILSCVFYFNHISEVIICTLFVVLPFFGGLGYEMFFGIPNEQKRTDKKEKVIKETVFEKETSYKKRRKK